MKRTLLEWLMILAMIVIVGSIVLLSIDAGTATPSKIRHCVVSEKHFTPAHTESDGDNITVHPNRWYIIASPLFVEVDVTQEQYEHMAEKQAVDVLVNKGGVVGGEYYTIAPSLEAK